MRVGLLGGSFDPVHYGHLRAAEWALAAFDLQEVRLMPARQSPFKNACVASEDHRLAMLRLAILDNQALAVEERELQREAPSYTVDTLRALTRLSPLTRFVLIVGSDAASGLEKWRDISEVRRMAEIRILNRPGDPLPAESSALVPFEGLDISSTEIRAAVRNRRSIRYLIPEPVRLYIEEKGLYQ